MSIYDCATPAGRVDGIEAAARLLSVGQLVVLPTDTVYGIAADAFTPQAVSDLLAAKGRTRAFPPPVLIASLSAAEALCEQFPASGRALAERFWPGALTLVCRAQPALMWDLGDTRGTVAIRMPDDDIALALLRRSGPLAVSSANVHGHEPALSAQGARDQLGEKVSAYLDGGPAKVGESSTIVDVSSKHVRILRAGALSVDDIAQCLRDGGFPQEADSLTGVGADEHSADESPTQGGTDRPQA